MSKNLLHKCVCWSLIQMLFSSHPVLLRGGNYVADILKAAKIENESSSDESGDVTFNAELTDVFKIANQSDSSEDEWNDANISSTSTGKNKKSSLGSHGAGKSTQTWTPSFAKENVLPVEEADPLNVQVVATPLDYFKKYFDEEHFANAAFFTNMNYLLKTGVEINTTAVEIKKFYGIIMIMGCFPYPNIEMYWKYGYNFSKITDQFSRKRFRQIRAAIHYVDLEEPNKNNLFWKIQPMIDAVRSRCLNIERKISHYSISEQIIVVPGQTGLKNFVVATTTGLIIDFEIYQGEKTNLPNRNLGLGPAVILRLCQTIPPGSFLYFDRYFTSVPLLKELLLKGFRATGSIRMNRLENISFKNDKNMKLGDAEEYIDDSNEVMAIKWMDSKCVYVISTISGIAPLSQIKHYNKVRKCFVNINYPSSICGYNKHMGGVDIFDQMMEFHRISIKSKEWTVKVYQHLIDFATVNSWLEYRLDCERNRIAKNKILKFLDFKLDIANSLIDSIANVQEEQPLSEEETEEPPTKISKSTPLPSTVKRFDGFQHWPVQDALTCARKCRRENCISRTRGRCTKCDVYLCCSSTNNCFQLFHTE